MRLPGKLVLVVGPSGAGKDSLLREAARILAKDPHFVFPRRVITRPSHDEAEAHDSLTADEFHIAARQGLFALSWQAHGLHYGIPVSLDDDLQAGRTAVVNVSRAILASASERYPDMAVLHVTASPSILAERLARRGRETAADIAGRLAREPEPTPAHVEAVTILNDTTLAAATGKFVSALLSFSKVPHAATV
ncbi:phosphonate metabolism protein/1,5-bisphosphokinase (PRPP-forming) PhnN [Taklimakanibacter lacteus]|uniref:phosphonate metabolism protein/1,5-bisphosphokinase (PRPP-forming) PhnN n=1 Tax=Taklimakanibacter lacteus TaxID=2268456 RepID=UPI000E663EF5